MLRALPLGAAEEPGEQRVDQVRAADGAVQEAAATEEGGNLDVAVPHDVRLVVERVSGGVEDLHLQRSDRHDVAATHGQPVEVDTFVRGEQVRHAVPARQSGSAGEVVVVDVGVGDGRDVDARLLGGPFERCQVARRIDHERSRAVVDEVGAVPELGYLDRDDLHESPCHQLLMSSDLLE